MVGEVGPEQEVRPEYEAVAWPADREGESPLARPAGRGCCGISASRWGNYGATSVEAAGRVRPVLERAAADRPELVQERAKHHGPSTPMGTTAIPSSRR